MKKRSLIFAIVMAVLSSYAWAKIPEDLKSQFNQAVQLGHDGKVAEAEGVYRKLIAKYPKVPELYNNLAVLLVKQGKQDKAVKVLEQGLRSQGSFASMYNNLVDINLSLSRRNYMKALVPVGDDIPKLRNDTKLSEIADVYYGRPDQQQLAMAEQLKKAEAAKQQAMARVVQAQSELRAAQEARDEAQVQAQVDAKARARAESRAQAAIEARDKALAEAKAHAASSAQALAEAKQAAAQAQQLAQAQQAKAAKAHELALAQQAEAAKARQLAQAAKTVAQAQTATGGDTRDEVPPVMNLEDQAHAAVMAWADAWSRQDVTAYVNAYVNDYSSDNLSRKQWLKQRKQRLTRPAFIKVKLSNFEYFILDSDHIAVHFMQSYSRKHYSDKGQKELVLVRKGASWKIEKERSL